MRRLLAKLLRRQPAKERSSAISASLIASLEDAHDTIRRISAEKAALERRLQAVKEAWSAGAGL